MEKWLNYDQVSLIPTKVSTLNSRKEADTSVQFGPFKLSVPMIAAPMPDVCDYDMAKALSSLGALGIINRFRPGWGEYGIWHDFPCGVAMSPKTRDKEFEHFIKDGKFKIICIDTANGASMYTKKAIEAIKSIDPDIFIIAGNVASAEAFNELEKWGADAIRVGIAGGSVCETRTETGVYSPMASVLIDIVEHRTKLVPRRFENFGIAGHAKIIADGGIKTPAHMCKALALGADVVMVGGIFAGTDESPGPVIKTRDGKKHKLLRGAASFSVQKETGAESITYNEGAEDLTPYKGSVKKIIDEYTAGLRSSMSYMNSRNLTEYRQNVKIVEVGEWIHFLP